MGERIVMLMLASVVIRTEGDAAPTQAAYACDLGPSLLSRVPLLSSSQRRLPTASTWQDIASKMSVCQQPMGMAAELCDRKLEAAEAQK